MGGHEYICPQWRPLLAQHDLADFHSLWQVPLDAVDEPNEDRGGWSQVFMLALKAEDGTERKAIVKRQRGHLTRTPLHCMVGIPTFRREFDNIRMCDKKNIPSMHVVYYGQEKTSEGLCSILVTEFLDGYIQLDKLGQKWNNTPPASHRQRRSAIEASATLVKKMHDCFISHGHLYPKHIMVNNKSGAVDARLIDLEGMRYIPFWKRHLMKDLSVLNRRNKYWQNTDKMRFLLSYLDKKKLDEDAKKICRRILNRKKKKKQ